MRRSLLLLFVLAACRLRAPDGPEDLPPTKAPLISEKIPDGATAAPVEGYPIFEQEVSFYLQGAGPLESKSAAQAWLSKVPSTNRSAAQLVALLQGMIEETDFSSSRLFVFTGESPQLPEMFRVERDVIVFSRTARCSGGMAPPRVVIVMRVPNTPKETKTLTLGSTAGCPTNIP